MTEELIRYFRDKESKYLNLENGKKVKLENVKIRDYSISLTFSHNSRIVTIHFDGLYGDYITMIIPNGLHFTTNVKFNSLSGIGIMIERVLCNWSEQQEEILSLDWED